MRCLCLREILSGSSQLERLTRQVLLEGLRLRGECSFVIGLKTLNRSLM
jgi:hypothetical protein